VEDALTELLREGARDLIQAAVEAEVADFLARFTEERDACGRQRVVRNGHLPERSIQTGIGEVPVRVPRVRDRGARGDRVQFHSSLVPPYLRRAKSVEELLPWLYLKGVSTGDFGEALSALLGNDAPGLSASTISRHKKDWLTEYKAWRARDLSKHRIVYLWADGVYCNVRFEDSRLCLLVLIGADETGKKRLLAVEDGFRESEQSWRELLVGLQRRGMTVAPKLAIGDGALGFWKALRKVYGDTRQQRCWMHKTGNILPPPQVDAAEGEEGASRDLAGRHSG
jgi:transposase-like protein